MDIINTQIFKIENNKIKSKIKHDGEFKEKKVQKFYENNLDKLLDARFVESEFAFEGGRIDTFAIDNDNNPLIIEYKRNTSDSVLLQALFYKDAIQRNWEKWYYTVSQKLGHKIADEINWSNIRVVIVAQEFDKWTKASTSFLEKVDLYKFYFYENSFIQEHVNAPKNKQTKKMFNKDVPKVGEADYSKDEYVISSSGRKDRTNFYRLNSSEDHVGEIYSLLLDYISEYITDYEIIYTKDYWYAKAPKKFIEFMFKKKELEIGLFLTKSQFDKEDAKFKDVSNIGSWGSLQSIIKISTIDDFEKYKNYVKLSFKNIQKKFM